MAGKMVQRRAFYLLHITYQAVKPPVKKKPTLESPRPLPAREGRCVAEALFRDGLCLPSGTAMSEDDLARVVEVVRSLHSTHPPT